MRFARYVGERPILVVAIQPGTLALGLVLLAKILAHDVGHRRPVAGYENVGPSIVVVVEEPAGEAHVWLRNAGLPRHVDELRYLSLRPDIAKEVIGAAHQRYIQIGPPVVVIIVGGGALDHSTDVDAGLRADVGERAIAVVDVEAEVARARRPCHLVAHDLVADEK